MSSGSPSLACIGHGGLLNDAPLFLLVFGFAREGVKVNVSNQPAAFPSDVVGLFLRCSVKEQVCSYGSKSIPHSRAVHYCSTFVYSTSTRVGTSGATISRIARSLFNESGAQVGKVVGVHVPGGTASPLAGRPSHNSSVPSQHRSPPLG